jgi:hypothetical protein
MKKPNEKRVPIYQIYSGIRHILGAHGPLCNAAGATLFGDGDHPADCNSCRKRLKRGEK